MEKQEVNRQIEALRKQIDQLEQQVNKPKIEVGKVYKDELDSIIMIKSIESYQLKGFGIVDESWYDCRNTDSYYGLASDTKMIEATKEEWETALTKHADKLYEGVEKVDRGDWDDITCKIATLDKTCRNRFDDEGFMYKGIYVMDKHGVWAKPVIESKPELDYDIEIHGESFKKLITKGIVYEMQSGKYKLVKVS
jgi:hypothetical protein